MEVGSQLGLVGRPLRLELPHLQSLRVPAILHWDMNHFVVLRQASRSGVVIHDPAFGARRYSNTEVAKHFTGVALELTPELLLQLHALTTKGLGREDDPHFKPHHEGAWRDGMALVVDRLTQQVLYEGPPPEEVDARMRSTFSWMRRKLDSEQPFVVAGVMHYGITDVHPFADGNGRVARLFQAAVLTHAQVLPGRMFELPGWFRISLTANDSMIERSLPGFERALEGMRAGKLP